MSVVHLWTIANAGPWNPGSSQFRQHVAIPFDDAHNFFANKQELEALIRLCRAAQLSGEKMKGRIFEVLDHLTMMDLSIAPGNALTQAMPDSGPYMEITGSDVFTRIELENLLHTWTAVRFENARCRAIEIIRLSRGFNKFRRR